MIGKFILGRYSRPNHSWIPTGSHRSHKRPSPSNITAKNLMRRNRPASRLFQSVASEPSPSSLPVYPSHYLWFYRRPGETVDSLLYPSHDVGEHCRSREGTPGQAPRAPGVGIAPNHGVPARHAAVFFFSRLHLAFVSGIRTSPSPKWCWLSLPPAQSSTAASRLPRRFGKIAHSNHPYPFCFRGFRVGQGNSPSSIVSD